MVEDKIDIANKPSYLLYYLVIAAIVILIWFLAWIFLPKLTEDPGRFGDMFGSINALFSGLALAGIIVTIVLQNNELKIQRKELALQRQELTLTRNELAKSAKAHSRSTQVQTLLGAISANIALMELYKEVARDGTNRMQGIVKMGESEAIKALGEVKQTLKNHIEELDKINSEFEAG